MLDDELKKMLTRDHQRMKEISEKLDKLVKSETAFRAKSTFWGMLGGAITSGILYVIIKFFNLVI